MKKEGIGSLSISLTYLVFPYISLDKYKISLEILVLGDKIEITNDYLSSLYSEYTYLTKQRLLKKCLKRR